MLERLRQQAMVFNNTEEGIVITDPKGDVVDANPAFERITEYSLDELRGKTCASSSRAGMTAGST